MNLGDTLVASFNQVVNDLVTALPALIGALIILLVGYVLARVVSTIVRKLLQRTADPAFAKHGDEAYGSAARSLTPSSVGALVVFWVIMLVFLTAAANFLGWPQVSQLLNDFVGWLPNLIVAVIIVIAAPIVGRIVRGAIEASASQMGMSSGRTLGRVAEMAVIAFAVVVAINQVGIASDLVNILFIGVVAALAIGFGLAFGLGGRDVAGQVTEAWYASSKDAAAKVKAQAASSPEAHPDASTRFESAATVSH